MSHDRVRELGSPGLATRLPGSCGRVVRHAPEDEAARPSGRHGWPRFHVERRWHFALKPPWPACRLTL